MILLPRYGAPDANFGSVTSLLSCQGLNASTVFRDEKNVVWTPAGNAQISNAQSKFGGTSGLLDGTGDNIAATYSTANFDWWTSDYTVEAFVYAASWATWAYNLGAGDHPVLIGNADVAGPTNFWSFGPTTTGTVRHYYFNGAAQFGAVTTGTLSTSAWHHIAMCASAAGIRLFLNGTLDTTVAIAGLPQSSAAQPLTIGRINNRSISGHFGYVRITKGVARYSASFTPPSGPFPTYGP